MPWTICSYRSLSWYIAYVCVQWILKKSMLFFPVYRKRTSLKMAFEKGMCSSLSSMTINDAMVDGNDNVDNNIFSVLVVDDDNFVRQIHKMVMIKLGMEVQVAKNGKEAVDLHRAGASFNLILMDMEMPIMNGHEVCVLTLNLTKCELELKSLEVWSGNLPLWLCGNFDFVPVAQR